jgi:hypothetical protein
MPRIRTCEVFEYGITRPFPFKYFTLIVGVLGVLWFIILTVINIVSQGLSRAHSPKIQVTKWFPFIQPTLMLPSRFGLTIYGLERWQGRRQYASLISFRPENVFYRRRFLILALSTNQSGFSYTLGRIGQKAEYSVNGAAILYSNSVLQNCTVTQMNFKASGPAFKRPGACVLTVSSPLFSHCRLSSTATIHLM